MPLSIAARPIAAGSPSNRRRQQGFADDRHRRGAGPVIFVGERLLRVGGKPSSGMSDALIALPV